jgi:cobalt-zinc-cadmium efflux system outer membrane protein
MNRIYFVLIISLLISTSHAQNTVDSVLLAIEKNNSSLSAMQKNTDAEKIRNKMGLMPDNPEIEFNYLWGSPEVIGDRIDLTVKQSFDFPTTYIYQKQVSDLKNVQADLEYKKHYYEIVLKSRLLCSEITYLNALHAEYQKRYNNDLKIANSYKKRMEVGDATILEYNKAQISMLNTKKQLEQNRIELNIAQQKLMTLNGGEAIIFSDSIFYTEIINPNFENWYAQAASSNPMLLWLKQEVAISAKEKQLQTARSLPKLSAGYMQEKVVGEQFQGITIGVSVPLWKNKNSVKYARLKSESILSMQTDARLQFYNEMKSLHTKAIALQSSIVDFKQHIADNDIFILLEKAMEKGEISVSEYFYEIRVFYDNKMELLNMEKELQDTLAQLNKYNV